MLRFGSESTPRLSRLATHHGCMLRTPQTPPQPQAWQHLGRTVVEATLWVESSVASASHHNWQDIQRNIATKAQERAVAKLMAQAQAHVLRSSEIQRHWRDARRLRARWLHPSICTFETHRRISVVLHMYDTDCAPHRRQILQATRQREASLAAAAIKERDEKIKAAVDQQWAATREKANPLPAPNLNLRLYLYWEVILGAQIHGLATGLDLEQQAATHHEHAAEIATQNKVLNPTLTLILALMRNLTLLGRKFPLRWLPRLLQRRPLRTLPAKEGGSRLRAR